MVRAERDAATERSVRLQAALRVFAAPATDLDIEQRFGLQAGDMSPFLVGVTDAAPASWAAQVARMQRARMMILVARWSERHGINARVLLARMQSARLVVP